MISVIALEVGFGMEIGWEVGLKLRKALSYVRTQQECAIYDLKAGPRQTLNMPALGSEAS